MEHLPKPAPFGEGKRLPRQCSLQSMIDGTVRHTGRSLRRCRGVSEQGDVGIDPCEKQKRKAEAFLFLCERGDSNPHGVTTRTSNVLVYHSNTLAKMLKYYTPDGRICQ